MAKFKAGDEIVFGRCKKNRDIHMSDITVGKIYTLFANHDTGDLIFYDDSGDHNHAHGSDGAGKATKIID